MINQKYTDAIYELPSSVKDTMLNHKKTPSFKKSVLGASRLNATTLRKSQVPDPGAYTLKSDIERALDKNKGPKFGLSHQAYNKVYAEEGEHRQKGWTEPGKYDIKSFVDIALGNKRRFTIGQRDLSKVNKE